jgi:hypothetical protein
VTPKQLEQAGKHRYGKRWKAPLARELGINYSTLWRYVTRQLPIPRTVALAVLSITAKQ